MKNEKNEQILNNNVVSDEALKNVSGGTQWVEMGGFGTTFQSTGIAIKVRVVNGSKCPTCGGTTGFMDCGQSSELSVKCEKCKTEILSSFVDGAIEIL